MLATFAVEVCAALYVFLKYRSNKLQKLSIFALLLLATFQLAEFNVCGQFGIRPEVWSRLGYVAITLLPALGLHITYELAKRKPDRIVAAAYASSGMFAGLFAFASAFQSYACGGNYVIFQLKSPIGALFFVYYYFWLFAAIFMASRFVKMRRTKKNQKQALTNHVIGYALFMIPTSLSMMIFPDSAAALPSVMCGFAVLYALTLTFAVLPATLKKKPAVRLL